MRLRRLGFASLVLASCAALLWLMAITLFVAGPDPIGLAMLVLFGLTVVVSILTIVPGRATRLAGVVHLVLLLAFVFLAISP